MFSKVSWTQALRTIVKNCYKQHGREDLLYAFEDQITTTTTHHHLTTAQSIAHLVPQQTVVQTINNPDGTVSLIQVRFRSGSFFAKSAVRNANPFSLVVGVFLTAPPFLSGRHGTHGRHPGRCVGAAGRHSGSGQLRHCD